MVENRPGHEDAQQETERNRHESDAVQDMRQTEGSDSAEPTAPEPAELHGEAAEQEPTIVAEPQLETPIERPETRFADDPRPAAEPQRPSLAAMMLPPVLAVAIAAAVVVGAAKTGLLPQFLSSTSVSAPENDAAIDALKARIAELEARPAAAKPVADATALDALAARIASLEARPAAAADSATATATAGDAALTGKVEALEKSVATLRDDLAALRGQSDQLAATIKDLKAAPSAGDGSAPSENAAAEKPSADSAAALAAITTRLGELEQAAKAATEAAPKAPSRTTATDDVPLRRLVTATMLDLTVKQGAPYAAVLKAAQPLADPATLKPLEAFADTGVPSATALGRELIALLPKLLSADDAASGSNFIDRFQANAERLVRIQRSDAAPGPDRTAIIGRLTAAAQRGDLAEARRELKALAPAERAPVQSWIDKSEARDQALAASQSFAAAALAALSKPSP